MGSYNTMWGSYARHESPELNEISESHRGACCVVVTPHTLSSYLRI
jgi:hypothetical protein